jgi:hypothetical protein
VGCVYGGLKVRPLKEEEPSAQGLADRCNGERTGSVLAGLKTGRYLEEKPKSPRATAARGHPLSRKSRHTGRSKDRPLHGREIRERTASECGPTLGGGRPESAGATAARGHPAGKPAGGARFAAPTNPGTVI